MFSGRTLSNNNNPGNCEVERIGKMEMALILAASDAQIYELSKQFQTELRKVQANPMYMGSLPDLKLTALVKEPVKSNKSNKGRILGSLVF